MKTIDFTQVNIGTRVFSLEFGWGQLISKSEGKNADYPILAEFAEAQMRFSYTTKGERLNNCSPTLFFDEPTFPDSCFKMPLQKGSRVLYTKAGSFPRRGYYAGRDENGSHMVFENGRDEWSSNGSCEFVERVNTVDYENDTE